MGAWVDRLPGPALASGRSRSTWHQLASEAFEHRALDRSTCDASWRCRVAPRTRSRHPLTERRNAPMRRLGLVLLLTAAGLFLGAGPVVAADYVIKLGHVIAPSEPIHQAFERMAERVKERTKGRVEIQVYPNSQLGSNKDTYEQARMGAPVMAHIDPGYASELGDTDIAILGGPFLYDSWDQAKKIIALAPRPEGERQHPHPRELPHPVLGLLLRLPPRDQRQGLSEPGRDQGHGRSGCRRTRCGSRPSSRWGPSPPRSSGRRSTRASRRASWTPPRRRCRRSTARSSSR